MRIDKMTLKQFKNLPELEQFKDYDFDSLVLMPSDKKHESGFNYYSIVICKNFQPIGILGEYEIFTIFASTKNERISIDCLSCGLMRIFLKSDTYTTGYISELGIALEKCDDFKNLEQSEIKMLMPSMKE